MKLSANTLGIFTSFSAINKSIYVEAGNVIKTKPDIGSSPTAKAVVEDEFPVAFGIYELNKFLQLIKMFDDPEFTFEEKFVKIEDKRCKAVYRYTAEDHISHPPYSKDFKLPTVDVEFELEPGDINQIIKSATTLGQPHIAFVGDKKNVYLSSFNADVPERQRTTEDIFSISIAETDKRFTMIFDTKDFKFINSSYNVQLSFKGIAKFSSENLTYWVSPNDKSKYE